MRKIKYSIISEIDLFKDVANAKRGRHRAALLKLIRKINNRYSAYEKAKKFLGKCRTIKKLKSGQRAALNHAYDGPTTPLKRAKSKIIFRLGTNYKCPYCSIGNGKKTMDHFLPKEKFPEFAILTKNLIPTCRDCNNLKGVTVPTIAKEQIFNPYFHRIPKGKFLNCAIVQNIKTRKLRAKYILLRPSRVSKKKFELIENHYSNLDLLEVYNDESGVLLNDFISFAELNPEVPAITLASRKASQCRQLYGTNNYQTVLFDELAGGSSDFLP